MISSLSITCRHAVYNMTWYAQACMFVRYAGLWNRLAGSFTSDSLAATRHKERSEATALAHRYVADQTTSQWSESKAGAHIPRVGSKRARGLVAGYFD